MLRVLREVGKILILKIAPKNLDFRFFGPVPKSLYSFISHILG